MMRVDQTSPVDFYEVKSGLVDVSLTTIDVPYPINPDLPVLDVDFYVDDLAEKIDFDVARSGLLTLDYVLDNKCLDVDFEFKWPETRYPYYDGSYIVDPKFEEQVLNTQYKSMAKDVVVNPIHCEYIENEFGGYTVKIGKVD